MTDEERIAVVKVQLRFLGIHPDWIEYAEKRINYTASDFEMWLQNAENHPEAQRNMFGSALLS